MTWLSKHPPLPFYGPDDYYGQDVNQAIADADAAIERWHAIKATLSVLDSIKHAISFNGCMVRDRRCTSVIPA